MKLLFAHDHIFYKSKSNLVYSAAAYPVYAWERYLKFFNTIEVMGRFGGIKEDAESTLVLSSRENVNFTFVQSIASPLKLLMNKKIVYKEILSKISQVDAVVVRLPSENGLLAIECAKTLNKPYAIEVVGCAWDALWNYGSLLSKLYAPIAFIRMKKTLSQSNKTLYVTENFLQKRYPSSKDSLTVNASNVEIEVSDVLVQRNFNKNEKIVFGLIGNFKTRYKGLHLAIEAFGTIKKQIKEIEFRVLGKGEPKEYEELIKKNHLNSEIVFNGSLPNGGAVLNWLDAIDIYIQPSLQEGLPRATIEAMSRGCVCIGSDVGGIPELLDSDFIHKAGDVQSLIDTLLHVLHRTPDELQKISKNNYKNSKKYDKKNIHLIRKSFYGALYKEVIRSESN